MLASIQPPLKSQGDIMLGKNSATRVSATVSERKLYACLAVRNEHPVDLLDAQLRLERLDELVDGAWTSRLDIVSMLLAVSADYRSHPTEAARTDIRPDDSTVFDLLVPANESDPHGDEWFIVAANADVRPRLGPGQFRLLVTLTSRDRAPVRFAPIEVELGRAEGTMEQTCAARLAEGVEEDVVDGPAPSPDDAEGARPSCDSGSWVVLDPDFHVVEVGGKNHALAANGSLALAALHDLGRPASSADVVLAMQKKAPTFNFGATRFSEIFRPDSPLRPEALDVQGRLWVLSAHRHRIRS